MSTVVLLIVHIGKSQHISKVLAADSWPLNAGFLYSTIKCSICMMVEKIRLRTLETGKKQCSHQAFCNCFIGGTSDLLVTKILLCL